MERESQRVRETGEGARTDQRGLPSTRPSSSTESRGPRTIQVLSAQELVRAMQRISDVSHLDAGNDRPKFARNHPRALAQWCERLAPLSLPENHSLPGRPLPWWATWTTRARARFVAAFEARLRDHRRRREDVMTHRSNPLCPPPEPDDPSRRRLATAFPSGRGRGVMAAPKLAEGVSSARLCSPRSGSASPRIRPPSGSRIAGFIDEASASLSEAASEFDDEHAAKRVLGEASERWGEYLGVLDESGMGAPA